MNIAFKIPPEADNYSDMHMLAEVGHNEISFLIFRKAPLSPLGFYMYSLDKQISGTEYAEALENAIRKEHVLHQQFASCTVFCNYNESVLVPAAYYNETEKDNYCDLLFGRDKTSGCFMEEIKGADIKNVFRIPGKVHQIINTFFPSHTFLHSTSVQVETAGSDGDAMKCIVYHNSIKLLMFKQSKLQIVQYFEYEGPTDVCYHMLNICERFGVSPSVVQVLLSGMIEESSNLYREIYNYFMNVSFVSLPADTILSDKLNEHPHQFYAHLTALAACV